MARAISVWGARARFRIRSCLWDKMTGWRIGDGGGGRRERCGALEMRASGEMGRRWSGGPASAVDGGCLAARMVCVVRIVDGGWRMADGGWGVDVVEVDVVVVVVADGAGRPAGWLAGRVTGLVGGGGLGGRVRCSLALVPGTRGGGGRMGKRALRDGDKARPCAGVLLGFCWGELGWTDEEGGCGAAVQRCSGLPYRTVQGPLALCSSSSSRGKGEKKPELQRCRVKVPRVEGSGALAGGWRRRSVPNWNLAGGG